MKEQLIKISNLSVAKENARKTNIHGRLPELVASMKSLYEHDPATTGLIHPLTVIKARGSKHQIVTGQRRYLAAQQLIKEKFWSPDSSLRCTVFDGKISNEVSLAENQVRENMHAADQFEAFHTLAKTGLSVTDIAAKFGVSELVVKQRLKLAVVAPELIEEYKNDKLTLEQLMLFTLSDDHGKQLEVYERCNKGWAMNPDFVKRCLTDEKYSTLHKYGRFVGVDTYREAGGAVTSDLFSEVEYFDDGALLEKLMQDKVDREIETLKAEGWTWVEFDEDKYLYSYEFCTHRPQQREFTEPKQNRLTEIEEEMEKLSTGPETEESCEKANMLEQEQSEINKMAYEYTGEQKASSGVGLSLRYDGTLAHVKGIYEPEKTGTANKKNTKRVFSDKLVAHLTSRRNEILKYEISSSSDFAYDLLIVSIVLSSLHCRSGSEGNPLQVRFSLAEHDTSIEEHTQAAQLLEEKRAGLLEPFTRLEEHNFASVYKFVRSMKKKDKEEFLAFCVALCFSSVLQTESNETVYVERIMTDLDIDILKYWTPTAENCFRFLSKEKLCEIIKSRQPKQNELALMKKKKGELVAYAEEKCSDYIPDIMTR